MITLYQALLNTEHTIYPTKFLDCNFNPVTLTIIRWDSIPNEFPESINISKTNCYWAIAPETGAIMETAPTRTKLFFQLSLNFGYDIVV